MGFYSHSDYYSEASQVGIMLRVSSSILCILRNAAHGYYTAEIHVFASVLTPFFAIGSGTAQFCKK